MTLQIKARLATMLFLEYFIWGGLVCDGGHMAGAGTAFLGEQIGLVAGTTAIARSLRPFSSA